MKAVDDAVAAALDGKLVVVPTDTVYGLGTRADDPGATRRIFQAKGRSRDADLPVFVGSIDVAREVAVLEGLGERLAAAFWPGKLTIVVPRNEASRGWDLGGDGRTIGLRIPGHPLARAVTAPVGALAITSANRSGRPVCTTCDELEAAFGKDVEVYLCEARPLPGVASTVVDATTDDLTILREGSIGEAEIAAALG
ncbi:MAG: L-threonylcarbamoyladenylate synthase [Actinomycetota bacterium]